ncbi:protein FAM3D-like [Polypterus senegalus]|uniref:protein FAM3D-like n=1 Tax=Polypterus senegalus TaxID=55291 RepID=UPI001965E9EC|nr:protein FAM3D-like [Polypterus senegalus]
MRLREGLFILLMLLILVMAWLFISMSVHPRHSITLLQNFIGGGSPKREHVTAKTPVFKCRMTTECPPDYYAFYIKSGAANVVNPNICFENKTLLSGPLGNAGSGMNIAVLNSITGEVMNTGSFDMYSGDPAELLKYLKQIQPETFILAASADDIGTKMNDEIRDILTSFGSKFIKSVKFRDNWIFVGAPKIKGTSPFEQHLENNKETNKYDGWPEMLEMNGCIPKAF